MKNGFSMYNNSDLVVSHCYLLLFPLFMTILLITAKLFSEDRNGNFQLVMNDFQLIFKSILTFYFEIILFTEKLQH